MIRRLLPLLVAVVGLSACGGDPSPSADEARYLGSVSSLDLSDSAALQAARDYCDAWHGEELDVGARLAIAYLPTGYKAVVADAAQEYICGN